MPKADADRASSQSLLGIIRLRVGFLPWVQLLWRNFQQPYRLRVASLTRPRETQFNRLKGIEFMARMKEAQINKPGANWELVERDIPEPGPVEIRIKDKTCGVCTSNRL